ncbi:MAG: ATP-dependent helicase [Phycisphaerae bacterium]|nr:ATP-dependent helicase [Phycisphaerae bacterium]
MGNDSTFVPPPITDEDIRWASRVLGLPEYAFYGEDGTDPRCEVLKSMNRIDVAACPGSGKTTLLVAKLAILAEKWQYHTRGICILSHTNAARDEIQSRLGNTTAARRLLGYPHFIGTIHGFVNEFLAIPWLRSRGYPITMIDSEVCEARRWRSLDHGSRYALERKRVGQSDIRIANTAFAPAKKSGPFPFAPHTPTYRNVRTACLCVAKDGYHCHDDMFIWAGDMMDKVPSVVATLRDRFPMLFVDEAQDNSEEQSKILLRIFGGPDAPVVRQRFGDSNQAIFSHMNEKGATTDPFPADILSSKDLPNSHRFGPNIAKLAAPLGLTPYEDGLIGHGPKKKLASGNPEGPHTIFLFDDASAENVLEAYGKLLIRTFSEQELRDGTFTAVGQVHRPPKDEETNKFPHHVAHYWHDYDAELTSRDPVPNTFLQYVFAAQAKAEAIGEAYPAVEKIAEGILRFAAIPEGGTDLNRRRRCHRYVLQLLEGSPAPQRCYSLLMSRFALRRKPLTVETWNNRWRSAVREIAQAIAAAHLSGPESDRFLAWNDEPITSEFAPAARKSRDNIYRYPRDAPKVHIRVGSIHSVKGETHTATLVLETFWHDHNLASISEWLGGPQRASRRLGERIRSRLKLHYVAMTRPKHLLCLAMKRNTFENSEGNLAPDKMADIERQGWHIKPV